MEKYLLSLIMLLAGWFFAVFYYDQIQDEVIGPVEMVISGEVSGDSLENIRLRNEVSRLKKSAVIERIRFLGKIDSMESVEVKQVPVVTAEGDSLIKFEQVFYSIFKSYGTVGKNPFKVRRLGLTMTEPPYLEMNVVETDGKKMLTVNTNLPFTSEHIDFMYTPRKIKWHEKITLSAGLGLGEYPALKLRLGFSGLGIAYVKYYRDNIYFLDYQAPAARVCRWLF